MNLYFAPMEGITGYIYRKAHHTYFNHVDRYYSPFISANESGNFRKGERDDLLPENNPGLVLIPQLLTNKARDFIVYAGMIKEMGYGEINLNLGCPSGTVVAKSKGSGFLAKKAELDAFLYEIFAWGEMKISIKTRLGIAQPEEFYALLEIFNKYPVAELTIHPRVRKDFYKNKPNLEVFRYALDHSKNPVCYNGNIFTVRQYQEFTTQFPEVGAVMMGRGLLANPGLAGEIKGGIKADKQTLREFHDQIYSENRQVLFGERNVLFRMKEIWFELVLMFSESDRYAKRIRKAERLRDYEEAVASLFRDQELIPDEEKNFEKLL